MNRDPTANSGLTNKQKWALESKARQGWKFFYMERDRINALQEARHNYRAIVNEIRNGEAPDLSHLTNMFLELYEKVGELCNCPVCLETMLKDNTHIPMCGHLICKTCKAMPAIDKCPICRRAY
jgi:hypothetical protein